MKLGHTKVKHLLALDVVVCHQALNLFVIYKKLKLSENVLRMAILKENTRNVIFILGSFLFQ